MSEIKTGTNEFYMEENGEVIAKIQYFSSGTDESGKEIITVNHTIVNEDQGGKGLGKKLVHHIAEYAKAENKLIIPECSYAKHVLEKSDEYQSVLAK